MYKVGFIGLGKIGYNLAGNISKYYDTYVWNRSIEKSNSHTNEYNTNLIKNLIDITVCDIILFCLPTYKEVSFIINKLLPQLKINTILIDCTSSDYNIQKDIYNKLKLKNIYYFDAPVSGGPEKAKTGQITCMIGGDENKFHEIEDVFKSFSKPQYVGKIGIACAIKSINNIMNVSHLCLAAEALRALENIGIDKKIALNVINKSSGRSLMTEERIPKHIMEKNYNYGFSLGLMNKDVNLALNIIKEPIMFSNISSLLEKSLEKYGNNADYTEVAKLFFDI
jgi:3-hydroxyisobutyrate dehydrogenase